MTSSQDITLNRANVITKTLAAVAALLVLASVGGQLAKYLTGHENLFGLIRLFNLDADGNIPTFFSALLLLIASLLLMVIGLLKRRAHAPYALQWQILAAVFLYLAVDEAAMLHELLSRPTTALLGGGTSGIFYRTWVIPVGILAAFLALIYLKFWLHLPKKTRWLFCLAAVLYVGAAAGLEVIGGHYAELHGFDTVTYIALATLEETLELAGVIVFIHALLAYIESNYGKIRIRFEPSTEGTRTTSS